MIERVLLSMPRWFGTKFLVLLLFFFSSVLVYSVELTGKRLKVTGTWDGKRVEHGFTAIGESAKGAGCRNGELAGHRFGSGAG